MVAPVDVDEVRVAEPHGKEEDDALHRLGAFVHDVAIEKVIVLGRRRTCRMSGRKGRERKLKSEQ